MLQYALAFLILGTVIGAVLGFFRFNILSTSSIDRWATAATGAKRGFLWGWIAFTAVSFAILLDVSGTLVVAGVGAIIGSIPGFVHAHLTRLHCDWVGRRDLCFLRCAAHGAVAATAVCGALILSCNPGLLVFGVISGLVGLAAGVVALAEH